MVHRPNSLEASYSRRLEDVLHEYDEFRRFVVPLCAAETPISDYVRSFCSSALQEKYAIGGPLAPEHGNFVGAEHVLALHQLIIDLCRKLYGSEYADPRPSTGIGAITGLLMTLSKPGQTVALQTTDSGGHPSMAPICRRLGLNTIDVPYDFERLNFDFNALSSIAKTHSIDFVLLAPSDLLYPPKLEDLRVPDRTTILYDATQTLGLIASGALPNPIGVHERMVLLGGTHKTLPGPSSGLILTSHAEIAGHIDGELNPIYLRHSQPNQMAALAACLIEQQAIGASYAGRIQSFSRVLSEKLAACGVTVVQHDDRPSQTHQIFISLNEGASDAVYERFSKAGVTLNKKNKRLFRGEGLRLGVQEIARYQWRDSDIQELAFLVRDIVFDRGSAAMWTARSKALSKRNIVDPELQVDSVFLEQSTLEQE